jgi:hypothetical protein
VVSIFTDPSFTPDFELMPGAKTKTAPAPHPSLDQLVVREADEIGG